MSDGGAAAVLVGPAKTRVLIDRLKRASARAAASNPEDAPLASGVTLTQSATTNAGLTKVLDLNNGLASRVRMTGGKATPNGLTALYFPVSSVAPSTSGNMANVNSLYNGFGWEIEFDTDSPIVETKFIGFTAPGYAFRVIVDGQYVSYTATNHANNNTNNFITLDFAGVRKTRTIKFECAAQVAFRAINVVPNSQVSFPTGSADKVVGLFTGDSYSEGQGALSFINAWPKSAGRRLGITDVRQVAVGATGYLSDSNGTRKKIANQISDWFTVNSDIAVADVGYVFVAAGYNDYSPVSGTTYTPSQIATEALADWLAIRALLPNAVIAVLGVHCGCRGPDTRTTDIETALASSFATWADGNSLFVPVATATPPWFVGDGSLLPAFTGALVAATSATLSSVFVGSTGTYNIVFSDGTVKSATLTNNSTAVSWSGAVTASAQASAYITIRGNSEVMVSPDRTHPIDLGHQTYARLAASAVRAWLAGRGL